ncbi:hypothetical protein CKOHBEJN_00191 [Aeromonas hydrophila]|uniref:Kiwa anti-phage protein KwaB-like domain-containing protein n=1 Tax=Aeromonas hydrophila TaxID=644 RepID=UPI00366C33D1
MHNVQLELDQQALDAKLRALKDLDLEEATINIWVADVKTNNSKKRFSNVKLLNIERVHKERFKQYVMDCIEGYDHIDELRPVTTIQDNRFFYTESSATDLSQLKDIVIEGGVGAVTEHAELNNFNSYAIQLTFGNPERSLFAFRYISGAWSLNRSSGNFLISFLRNDTLVFEINNQPRFQITPYIDFIQFEDDVFIADLVQFETAMNYHERLKEKKKDAIVALCDSPAVNARFSPTLTTVIGNDKRLMRQLASVHSKGHYSDPAWLRRLREVAQEAGNWQIEFDENEQIIIKEDKTYIKEILTLLQNKRVRTVVDGVMFDVDGELIAVPVVQAG